MVTHILCRSGLRMWDLARCSLSRLPGTGSGQTSCRCRCLRRRLLRPVCSRTQRPCHMIHHRACTCNLWRGNRPGSSSLWSPTERRRRARSRPIAVSLRSCLLSCCPASEQETAAKRNRFGSALRCCCRRFVKAVEQGLHRNKRERKHPSKLGGKVGNCSFGAEGLAEADCCLLSE